METGAMEEGRTVVVSGVPDVLPVDRIIDKLTIHFQSCKRSRGGDVDVVKFPTYLEGVAFVTFDKVEDAERVVRKAEQIMKVSEFPDDYLLTVFPFTRDVFLYVPRATVDLSLFGSDQASLIHSLRSAHRTLRFRPFLKQRKATIEGPFTGVQALIADLIHKASQLKTMEGKELSHHESVGSVSYSGSQAKPEPLDSLSTSVHTTGEPTEVRIPHSNAQTQNASSRPKVSYEGLPVGNFCDTDAGDKLKMQRARSWLEMPTDYGTKRTKANPRPVLGKDINAGVRASFSGVDLLPAEDISAGQPREYDISPKLDRITTSNIRREDGLGSRHKSFLTESDQSSLAITAKLLQTRPKDVSQSSDRTTKGAEDLSAICSDGPEALCILVDTNAFRYIEKFDKEELDRCLRGLKASFECLEGTDLMRIFLTDKRTSETASRVEQALENLHILVEYHLSTLRVHEIFYNKEEQHEKLVQICNEVSFLFDDVLYVFEDSCVKVVGRSVSSYLFHKRVTDRLSKLKDQK